MISERIGKGLGKGKQALVSRYKRGPRVLTNYMLKEFGVVKGIALEMVMVTLQRASNRTKKCKRELNVFVSREEEKNDGRRTRDNVKPI